MFLTVIMLVKDALIILVLELFQQFGIQGTAIMVQRETQRQFVHFVGNCYFSHLIPAFLTYPFFDFELRLLTEWEDLVSSLLCQKPSLKFHHLTVAGYMHQFSYTAFGHETGES